MSDHFDRAKAVLEPFRFGFPRITTALVVVGSRPIRLRGALPSRSEVVDRVDQFLTAHHQSVAGVRPIRLDGQIHHVALGEFVAGTYWTRTVYCECDLSSVELFGLVSKLCGHAVVDREKLCDDLCVDVRYVANLDPSDAWRMRLAMGGVRHQIHNLGVTVHICDDPLGVSWRLVNSDPEGEREAVVLGPPGEGPIVCGVKKPPLTAPQYRVIRVLKEQARRLNKDELVLLSGHEDARRILKRLAAADPDWRAVIYFPGGKRDGYGLVARH